MREVKPLDAHMPSDQMDMVSVALGPDGRLLAIGVAHAVQLVDVETGAVVRAWPVKARFLGPLDFSATAAVERRTGLHLDGATVRFAGP